jgi:hypothetical protein
LVQEEQDHKVNLNKVTLMFEDVEVQIKFYYYLNKMIEIKNEINFLFFTLFLKFLNDNNPAYHNELNVDYT